MAIMNPLKPRMGKRATLCIAVFIWVSDYSDVGCGLALDVSDRVKAFNHLCTIPKFHASQQS